MDVDVLKECRRLLLDKVQRYDPHNAEWIIDAIATYIPLKEIRWYSSFASEQKIRHLFDQASVALQLLPPQWLPSKGQGLGLQSPQSQAQFHLMDSSQRFQAPLPLPHSQFQFGPSGSFVNQAQFPGSNGSFGGNQAPFFLPRSEPQYYPSGNFSGHQAPFRPTGPGGILQSSFPGFSGSRGPLQSQSIPGDGMQLKTIKAIESDGQHYVMPATDYACGVGNTANDFKLALAPPSGGSNKYGPVNYVQIPTGRCYGFVSFMYPETVKLILPENRQRTHHICGKPVEVYPYKEKHELEKPAQRDAHSKSGAHIVSDINVTLRNTVESSNVSNHTDEISANQDSSGKEKGPDTEEELEVMVKQMKFIKGDFKANKIYVHGPNPLSHLLAARTQPQVYELPTRSACQCTEQLKFEAAIKSVQTKLNQETKGRVLEKLHRERIHIENVSKMLLSLEAQANQGAGGCGSVEEDGLRHS